MVITNGIEADLRQAFKIVIENGNEELFYQLNSFVRRVIQLSVKNKSLNHMERFIFFPSNYYLLSSSFAEPNFKSLHFTNKCIETAALHLKDIILFDIGFNTKEKKTTEELEPYNEFYYLAYYGFSSLLFNLISRNDYNRFDLAFNYFLQTLYPDDRAYNMKSRLIMLEHQNSGDSNEREIIELNHLIGILNTPEIYKRHVILGLRYWIYVLYEKRSITVENANKYLMQLRVYYSYSEDILKDYVQLKKSKKPNYFGWDDWDYMKRKSGQAFHPPNPDDWINLGFFIDQIKSFNLVVSPDRLDSKYYR